MVLERERDVIKLLISQTLESFCKSHLSFTSQITIDAMIGVTIDQNDVILVTVKESLELTDKLSVNSPSAVKNIENFSAETSDKLGHFSNNTRSSNEGESDILYPKDELSYMTDNIYGAPESVSAESDQLQTFDGIKPTVIPAATASERPFCNYGLDLTLHNKNSITVIEPCASDGEILEAEKIKIFSGHDANGLNPTPRDGFLCRSFNDTSPLQPSASDTPVSKQHLLLPFGQSLHRTNVKKRKIQLLANRSAKKPAILGPSSEPSALQGEGEEDVKIKVECTSPGLDLRVTCDEATLSEPRHEHQHNSLKQNKNNSTSSDWALLATKSMGSANSSHLLLKSPVSGQLPWSDFQSMLIKSWRRNHHEEMLLNPQAHAMIESWTNSSDATSHRRIGECVQAILLYEGRYVPVRDIQRLRLSTMTSQEIRSTMEFLNCTKEGKVGCYREIRGGIGVFYKCPPHLVDLEFLESFGLSSSVYETRYTSRMISNATNRHSAVYWYRIETCSPYLTSTEVF